jgi:hypothetical protein
MTAASALALDSFSASYAEARSKFLQACAQAGLAVRSHAHPLRGRDGEALALDVALGGPADAANLLVVSSGCHGIEGFSGSAVQVDLLRDAAWQAHCGQQADLAVLYVHALNPHGFSWERRFTHENVDLNRNFRDFDAPLADNPGYRALAPLLLPRHWPPGPFNTLRLMAHALRHGRKTVQSAISRGQHDDPDGLFYAGRAPTWSNQRLRELLRTHAQGCRRIGWIDIHTGLGPTGHGERIYSGSGSAESLARARRWWGAQVTDSAEGSSTSSVLEGTLGQAVLAECPNAQYNGMALEFGTLPAMKVLAALRAEQWLQLHPEASADQKRRIKAQLRAAFYVETDDWKRRVLGQAREVVAQTAAALAGPMDA